MVWAQGRPSAPTVFSFSPCTYVVQLCTQPSCLLWHLLKSISVQVYFTLSVHEIIIKRGTAGDWGAGERLKHTAFSIGAEEKTDFPWRCSSNSLSLLITAQGEIEQTGNIMAAHKAAATTATQFIGAGSFPQVGEGREGDVASGN